MRRRQSRKVIWGMINTLFLRLQLSNLFLLLSSSTHKQTSMASCANLSNFLKNSELKTTHNTFRDCFVHVFLQPFSKQLYMQGSLDQIDCIAPLEIQDILGYWIPVTGFQSLSVELGFWIPIVSGIPESLRCIPDSKAQDSAFHQQTSALPYMRRNTAVSSRSFEERQLHSQANSPRASVSKRGQVLSL